MSTWILIQTISNIDVNIDVNIIDETTQCIWSTVALCRTMSHYVALCGNSSHPRRCDRRSWPSWQWACLTSGSKSSKGPDSWWFGQTMGAVSRPEDIQGEHLLRSESQKNAAHLAHSQSQMANNFPVQCQFWPWKVSSVQLPSTPQLGIKASSNAASRVSCSWSWRSAAQTLSSFATGPLTGKCRETRLPKPWTAEQVPYAQVQSNKAHWSKQCKCRQRAPWHSHGP